MTYTIKLRRGTAGDWTTVNPVLAEGEFGYEQDTGNFKIGDGTTPWVDLVYVIDQVVGPPGPPGDNGTNGADGTVYVDRFTATAGQTDFVTTNPPTGELLVYRNGLLQRETTDYTVVDDTITLTTGALVGDAVTIVYGVVAGTAGPPGADGAEGASYIDYFTATAGQTAFTTSQPPTGVISVFRNGLLQRVTTDYTVAGSVVTLTTGALVGDAVTLMYGVVGGTAGPAGAPGSPGADGSAPLTTKGDLLTRNGSAVVRKGVGANGEVITADSTVAEGWKWAAPTGGSGGGDTVTAVKTANYTAANGELVPCNAAGGGFTVTLPAATAGRYVTVVKTDSSANPVTVVGASGATINGDASSTHVIQYVSATYVADGTNWYLKSAYGESGGTRPTIPTVRAKRTAGTVTFSSSSPTATDTATDLVIPAVVGDWIEVGVSCLWNQGTSGATWSAMDAGVMVSGSVVHYIGDGGSSMVLGVSGWFTGGGLQGKAGSFMYQVQSGDVSGGSITLRNFVLLPGGETRQMRAAVGEAFTWWVKNLGQI